MPPSARPRPHPGPRRPGPARPAPHRRPRGNRRSAGDVLVIGVVGLLLAALINADAMVARAEQKPFGAGRDRSLLLWHPVQDVSHVLQLHRIRDLGDALAGNEDRGSADAAGDIGVTTTIPPGATTTLPPRPEVRTPTAADPLRVWVGGDSIMRDLAESILRLTASDPRFDVTDHAVISSGLTRPDFFDWPAALETDMATTDAEVVVIIFGANDGQGIVTPDGTTFQRVSDPGWSVEYARRVAGVMDQLRDGDRLVYWVLQPPMRDADFDRRIQIIDDVYREAAATRPWIQLVETEELLGDANGRFLDERAGAGGALLDLRQDDGIHLARDGADLLAGTIVDQIEGEFTPDPAAGPPGSTGGPGSSTTTATTAPG